MVAENPGGSGSDWDFDLSGGNGRRVKAGMETWNNRMDAVGGSGNAVDMEVAFLILRQICGEIGGPLLVMKRAGQSL